MELLIGLDSLLLVDSAVFRQACQLAVVQYSRNDTLCNDSVPSVVDYGSRHVMQSIDFQYLKLSEAGQIVICLSPAWILIRLSHVPEVVVGVNCVREENEIVHEYLRFSLLCWVQRRNAALNDSNSSFCGRVQKVVINFGDGSISLSALGHIFFREILDNLVLLVPITYAFGVQSE